MKYSPKRNDLSTIFSQLQHTKHPGWIPGHAVLWTSWVVLPKPGSLMYLKCTCPGLYFSELLFGLCLSEALWRHLLIPASGVLGSTTVATAPLAPPAPGLPPAPGRGDPQLHTGQQLCSVLQPDAEIRRPTSDLTSWRGMR